MSEVATDRSKPGYRPVEFLIVDDDEISVMAIRRAMQKLKLANPIRVARDGVEALALLEADVDDQGGTASLPPCIVTLDLNMPRMGGLEFLERIRGNPRLDKIVVFVLTTSDAPTDIAAAYEKHIAGYIVKENAAESLRNALAMLGDYATMVVLPS